MQISKLLKPSEVKNSSIFKRVNRPVTARTCQFLIHINKIEAGYLAFTHRPDIKTGVLYEMFVLPEFRSRGIGTRLVAYTGLPPIRRTHSIGYD